MNAIEIKGLTKKFGKLTAVNRVSLTIPKGEIFGLLGPNGAGKTTLLSMLAVLLSPSGGRATVCGHDIAAESLAVRRCIGMVFQSTSLDNLLTARENLQLHARLYAIPIDVREKRIDEVLDMVELAERQHDIVDHYSGGMKKRLEIARGLLHRPAVLFLDEPTLGLDPQNREHIWAYLQKLARREQMTVIITTHYMEEADLLCNRIALIDRGRIMRLDTPAALKRSIGGDRVRLSCSQQCGRPLLNALRRLPFVKSVRPADNQLELVVLDAPAHLQKILSMAGNVREVHVLPASLNDVFLKYTGHEIRDEGGGSDGQNQWSAHR
ncbi:MAG: ATP-binding cassette domain-containing protein [Candidatus Micrarchaeota archaeon]|nr:ATP-binding cassette domain-containing protein [Candidatus Micrarchaeota archaeon]